jgi:hypothetical protein
MEKILVFTAFLVVYGLYFYLAWLLSVKFADKKENILTMELLIIVPNVFLFAFLFIIGRFVNLQLLIMSIVFSNIGLICTLVIWGLVGNPKTPYKSIGGWAGSDFGFKNAWMTLLTQILALLIMLAFPVIVGINFFSQSSIEAVRLFALKYTLILVLSSYIIFLPYIVGVLSAGFIDEDTRARYLIAQFSGLIPNALFVSLLFWTFNLGQQGEVFQLGEVNFVFNPLLFGILIGLLLLFYILPYFIGVQKAKRLKEDYFELNMKLLDKVFEAINLATVNNIVERLENVRVLLIEQYNRLKLEDRGFAEGMNFDQYETVASVSENLRLVYVYYKMARPFDTRFKYYDFLNAIYLQIEELKQLQVTEQDPEVKVQLMEKYAGHFKTIREDLEKENEKKSKAKPALWLGIIAVSSPIISQLMSEIGGYLITLFKNV